MHSFIHLHLWAELHVTPNKSTTIVFNKTTKKWSFSGQGHIGVHTLAPRSLIIWEFEVGGMDSHPSFCPSCSRQKITVTSNVDSSISCKDYMTYWYDDSKAHRSQICGWFQYLIWEIRYDSQLLESQVELRTEQRGTDFIRWLSRNVAFDLVTLLESKVNKSEMRS